MHDSDGKEDRYRTLVDASPEATYVVRDGIIEFLNPAAVRMFRAPSADALLGTAILDRVHPEDHARALSRRRQVLELGVSAPLAELRFTTLDGHVFEGEAHATAVDFDGHRATYAAVRDVSARKQAERALRDSEARFRSIFRDAPLGVAVVDSVSGLFREVNARFAEIAGRPATELGVLDWMAVTHPDDVDGYGQLLAEMNAGALPGFTREQRYRRPDASEVWLRVTVAPLGVDVDGAPPHLCMVEDITRRRELEEHLRQAQKLEAVGRLAGGVAHDFNNALAVILGYTEFALQEVDAAAPLNADLQEIQRAAKRCADLTRKLLTYARRHPIAPRALDLNCSIEDALRVLRQLIGESIRLEWEPGRALWQVFIDPSQLDQILTNLCANARDAITGAGVLKVDTANRTLHQTDRASLAEVEPGEYVRLRVSDNGRGMHQAVVDMIFEPFFTTKDIGEGSGLGLATVYGIVRQNHGFITVTSEPDRGTTFEIFLPRRVELSESSGRAAPTLAGTPGTETILLVEDEPAILRLATRALAGQGYTVLAASGPEEALEMERSHAAAIDLLVTDVMMPGMSGPELAKAVTARRSDVRLLFISGYSADLIAELGRLNVETQFLGKPFTLNQLTTQVRVILDRG